MTRAAALVFPRIEFIDKFHFEIVKGCQLRCVGCPISTLQPKVQRIAPEDFDACLRNVDVRHVRFLRLFNYGEPLLHKNLVQIVSMIPRQTWTVSEVEISTNAQFVYWSDLEEVFRTQVLTDLAVSCDGDGTPGQYEALRPPSRWEKLIEFLERARELRDRYHPKLRLITRTICPDPVAQQRWRQVLEPRGWTPEFRAWLYLPESAKNMTGRDIQAPRRVCSFQAVNDRLYVDWEGTVIPCCVHPKAGVLGNLHQSTYNDIMHSHARAQMLTAMNSNRGTMPICNACEF